MGGMAQLPRRTAAGALLGLAAPWPLAAQRARYAFDGTGGRLGFTARHLGLFTSQGQFERFQAVLTLDPGAPGTAQVAVIIETGFVSLPWPGATDLLRSEAYFDVARHPTARFAGQAAGISERGEFGIAGQLQVRGIEQPLTLTARLAERRGDMAAFTASGTIKRSDYGMTADRSVISDTVTLTVSVRLAV